MSRIIQIVAFAFVVTMSAHGLHAVTITEDFATNPAARGWRQHGNTNLFQWDSTNQNLRVTWDSSKTNSYFHLPLGTILSATDDFSLSFKIRFDDYASGTTTNKPFAAPAAVGFFNLDQSTHTNFSRGAGVNATYGPRNLVEFDFFPAFSSFLPTIAQVIVSTNNSWLYNHDNLYEMTPGETFAVMLEYSATTRTLTTTLTNNGAQYGDTQLITVPANFDFRVATFSVSSYSDVRDNGSILAHGSVDDIVITLPPPPVENFSGTWSNGVWTTQFNSRSNWLYTLERTTDLVNWIATGNTSPGNDGSLSLQDTNAPSAAASYRVRAQKP